MWLVNAAATDATVVEITPNLARGAIGRLDGIWPWTQQIWVWPALFDDALGAAMSALPTFEERVALGGNYLSLRFAEPGASR